MSFTSWHQDGYRQRYTDGKKHYNVINYYGSWK